ncbi:hypothetical protein TNIN_314601 [Trichonephila inaurata madagascariensis]|uniref:Uncharacterized protein n=1 Tax=Trichonephila inaurata madagascariensis TaxID=2747483 RepID=A0A8X6Y0X8_9ARAC|nr:hypothetical protein TNIN_314601 [Trichonephila inaurata madagascariensis]
MLGKSGRNTIGVDILNARGGFRGTGEFGGDGGFGGDGEGSCLSLLGNGLGRFGATRYGTGRRWVEGGRSSVSGSGEYRLGRSSESESLGGLYSGSTGL